MTISKTLTRLPMRRTALMLLIGLFSLAAHATLNGKPVVLVHGFQYQHLGTYPDTSTLRQDATEYWQEYWLHRAEVVMHWSSGERIRDGIADDIRNQVKSLADNGTCLNGCVFVTHSTGDLVTRYMLRNLNGWLWQWGYGPDRIKVLTVLDIAGAGGGTELADLGVSVVESDNIFSNAATSVVNWFLGTNVSPSELGVVRDLQPAVARSIATDNSAVPRLRMVGAGTEYLGAPKPFILGKDDSVVPLHSACGSVLQESLDSCSSDIEMSGEIDYVSKSPSGLLFNHFPIIMGEDSNHSDTMSNQTSGTMVPVVNNRDFNGLTVDFAEDNYWSWWYWDDMKVIRGGDGKSMSANVFDTLNW